MSKIELLHGDCLQLMKGTNMNRIITGVIFKEGRSYPYLKIKWDNVPVEPEKM